MQPDGRRRQWLAAYYFLYFATVGITLPFLPAYFTELGLSATQVGVLLALGPLVGLFGPPLFGRWEDRSGGRGRVLGWATAGTLIALVPLALARSFPAFAALMAVFALFNTALVPLVDALTLDHVASAGGSYAHVRLFGSIGFIVAAGAFGLAVDRVGRATLLIPVALLAVALLVAARLRGPPRPGIRARPPPLRFGRELWILTAATGLHWIASAPYNGTFILYVHALGLPNAVVGVSAGLGVAAEVGAMAIYPRIAGRVRPRTLLAISFLASALRWAGMATVTSAAAIVALTLLHGFTFGLFYVAAVDAVSRRVPADLRASGQALFAAVTFGLGGWVGYLAAGVGYDRLGGHRLFALAALVEVIATAVVLAARPAGTSATLARSPGP